MIVFTSYSLISDENITVAFEQTQTGSSDGEIQVYRQKGGILGNAKRQTFCELTRLKSLDSVLWSLRLLTGDFVLSARGDVA